MPIQVPYQNQIDMFKSWHQTNTRKKGQKKAWSRFYFIFAKFWHFCEIKNVKEKPLHAMPQKKKIFEKWFYVKIFFLREKVGEPLLRNNLSKTKTCFLHLHSQPLPPNKEENIKSATIIKVQFTLGTLMDLNDQPLPSSIKQSTQQRGKQRKNKERGPKSKPQSKTQTESQRGKGTNYKVQSQGWALGD